MRNEKIYQMSVSKVSPLLVAKVLKKGRAKEEVDENAPELNVNRHLIKGVVCGIRVEEIEKPLMREIRYLE